MLDLLDYHLRHVDLERVGFGLDEYAPDEWHEHPMAYALYLRGLVALYRATEDGAYLDRARVVREGLLANASPVAMGIAWGLPFAFRDLSPGHPYAITTAIAGSA